MSKVVESFVADAMNRVKSPEVQDALHTNVIAPLFTYILDMLYPYLIAIIGLWCIILIGILILLMRGGGVAGIK
jgi:hypothetical protein